MDASGTVSYYVGVVEDRDDPLKIGRCRVRVVGLHTEDKGVLPTEDLPWALPIMPITSANMSGVGSSPVGLLPGTWVMVIFRDADQQFPVMLGTIPGIHRSQAAETAIGDNDNLVTDGGVIQSPDGEPIKNPDGSDVVVGQDEYKNFFSSFLSSLGLGGTLGGIIGSILGSLFGGGGGGGITSGGSISGGGASVTPNANPEKAGFRAEPLNAADDSKPTVTPKVETKEEAKITAQPETNKAAEQTLNSPIPVKPGPEKYLPKSGRGDMEKGIQALLEACDMLGITNKYAKCAILGICGGETLWQPVEEGSRYSDFDRFTSTFKTACSKYPDRARKYHNWKGSKAEFFEFVYGFDNPKGWGLGNKLPGDGGKYYGRGFVQITGKSAYVELQQELAKRGIKVDIVNNPDSLTGDFKTSALVTVMYFVKYVNAKQDSPTYFKAALKRVGKAVGDSYIKKTKMYEYFLGQGVIEDSTPRPLANDHRVPDKEETKYLSPQKQATLSEDRPTTSSVGFQDPSGKYPLRNTMDEPSTNRLSRGVFKETAIAAKDQDRTRELKFANASREITWEQPLAPWGGMYPYSKVYESESGHLQIFDDTPGHETVSLTHRKGTFIDIDANGTQVNKIVGDGYTVIDRNGYISIAGDCTVNIGGNASVIVAGDTDLEVFGSCNANVRGSLALGVASDVDCVIGGALSLFVGGDINATVGGSVNLTTPKVGIKTTSLLATTDVSVSEVPDALLPITSVPEPSSTEAKSFEPLQTPVRPSPVVDIPPEIEAENEKAHSDFVANPDKYYDKEAEEAGVNPVRSPDPKVPDTPSQISGAKATDIQTFLTKQLELAREGYWSERAMKTNTKATSNPNIIAMWNDIGLGSVCQSDQTKWCAAFMNWVLKQCNYRYVSSARAYDIHERTEKYGATLVTGDVQPGDIVVWTFSHVSFVYKVRDDGKFTCVGGNQGGNNPKDNDPTGGKVTENYTFYIPKNYKTIRAIYRPSKA